MQRRVFSTAGAIATLVVPTLVYAQAASKREHYEKVGSAGNPGTTSTFK
jgi:hypothetical protein